VLGDGSISIDGAGGVASAGQLVIPVPRTSAGSRLLIAAQWLRDHDNWDFDVPTRKWDLPLKKDPENLAVELETFLQHAALDVESAVVATLFVDGLDPVRVATELDQLATLCLPSAESALIPPAWRPVAAAAQQAKNDAVFESVVSALAAARQRPQADPAAIDSVRAAVAWTVELPKSADSLRSYFPVLTQRAEGLRRALESSIDATLRELEDFSRTVRPLLGGDSPSEVGDAALSASLAANNENVFAGDLGRFQDAAKRLKSGDLDPGLWQLLLEDPTQRPPLARILEVMPAVPSLVHAAEDLRIIEASLAETRRTVDVRISGELGGESPDNERRGVLAALDELVSVFDQHGLAR